ncbi:MAG: DUF3857 domain-containing protein [Bacteroidales bacterium]|nr:DUF3857 domain-containing protein [Bacteroidales bacterium]
MKKIILAIFCLFIINLSFSQKENADAEYLKILKEYTLNADGSIDFHYSKQLKLLTHYSFHRLYGETFIIYNTDFQKLKINSAFTIMADGKKVVTPKNAFNEVLPRFSANAPAFNNIREMVVTHTGLERNTVINLDYTINSKKGFFPALMADEVLPESSPVKELIIQVNIPASKTLNFELLNFAGEPLISNKNGKKVYTWKFESIPANSKDYYQEADYGSSPRLIFSTSKDLKFVYDQFINQDAFVFNTNESMDKAIDKITSNETDQLTIALELQNLVSNDLKTLNIPLNSTGFKCRTAIETWKSNQGTHLENALLLTALLQKANIKAEPVAVIPNSFYNKEIGNLLSFKDFWVRINLKKYGEIFISAVQTDTQNLKFSLEGKTALLLDKNVESLKVFSGKAMTSKIFVGGDFEFQNVDKLVGNLFLELKAEANPYFNIYNDSSNIKSMIRGISSKNFTSTEIEKLSQEMSRTHFEFEKDDPFEKQQNYLTFQLPYVNNGVDSWHITLLPAERSAPLEIHEKIHERYEYAIVFPKELKPVSTPKNIEIKNDAGYLLIKFEKSANEILITREIKFDKKIFGLDVYDDFREIMNVWNNKNYRKVIFKE